MRFLNIMPTIQKNIKRNMNLGKKTNQNFVNIPLGNIKEKLEYLCEFYGIEFLKQEESYTSLSLFGKTDQTKERFKGFIDLF
ncbi:hypothetical protein B9L21_14120 [Geobacillus uzenensis]|uniref:Uncharacterized protein n=1 Tax=Geobacillus uzenensis TaxID=129339 RepID=A0ABX4DEB2_9BACL|nr:hypothetical protein B9L21_14120 [Geobacillus uzenensis]